MKTTRALANSNSPACARAYSTDTHTHVMVKIANFAPKLFNGSWVASTENFGACCLVCKEAGLLCHHELLRAHVALTCLCACFVLDGLKGWLGSCLLHTGGEAGESSKCVCARESQSMYVGTVLYSVGRDSKTKD